MKINIGDSGLTLDPRLVYPVGSVFHVSGLSTNPATLLGFGTWTLLKSDYDRIPMGSFVLYDGASGNTNVTKTAIIGSYSTALIDGPFRDGAFVLITPPTGYHREYKMEAQVNTLSGNYIKLYLSNIVTSGGNTWSSPAFRATISTGFFKEFDIVQESTSVLGYAGTGVIFWHEVTGTASNWQYWNVVINGYHVSNDIRYEWKRTA